MNYMWHFQRLYLQWQMTQSDAAKWIRESVEGLSQDKDTSQNKLEYKQATIDDQFATTVEKV